MNDEHSIGLLKTTRSFSILIGDHHGIVNVMFLMPDVADMITGAVVLNSRE